MPIRRTIRRTIRFALLASLAALPAAAQQDPRIGNWTLTAAQATLTPPNKLSITDVKDAVHVVISGETHLDFTAKPGAKDTAVPGNPAFNQVSIRRIDKHQTEVKEMKNGALVATIREKLSADSNELTSTTVAPGHPTQITAWNRTGGTKLPNDPFAGDWTQDPGKSRQRQGLTLKIEATPSGTHFVADYSYTARLDGKPYDLKNSRNDTVSLTLTDPHTVEATYRRDTQITQKDKWIVSTDGNQLTLTSSGTLESNQRFTETLTFKKQ